MEGVDSGLLFKAAKGRKKMTRKQLKDREERRRLRTVRWLSNSVTGEPREPDTDSDPEDIPLSGATTPKSGASTPALKKAVSKK